jgi:hypothetical protein
MCLFLNGLAALSEPAIEIRGQGGEGDGAQMRLEYGLDFAEGAVERTIYRLLYETAGCFGAMSHGYETRLADRPIDVSQRDGRGIAGDHPAATVAFCRRDETLIPKTGHNPADHDRVRSHRS